MTNRPKNDIDQDARIGIRAFKLIAEARDYGKTLEPGTSECLSSLDPAREADQHFRILVGAAVENITAADVVYVVRQLLTKCYGSRHTDPMLATAEQCRREGRARLAWELLSLVHADLRVNRS